MDKKELASKLEKLSGRVSILSSRIEYLIDLVEKGESKK